MVFVLHMTILGSIFEHRARSTAGCGSTNQNQDVGNRACFPDNPDIPDIVLFEQIHSVFTVFKS